MDSLKSFRNVAVNAMSPGYLAVMVEKVLRRLQEAGRRRTARMATQWCEDTSEAADIFGKSLNPVLWSEAEKYAGDFESTAASKLSSLGIDLGGGGDYRLLYFLVRLLRPACVVETGVAAGFSSHAMLTALQKNGSGRLFSSDFPYFRLNQPEQFVGLLVDEELRDRWELFLQGDRRNLPQIVSRADTIDLIHYDSDKSRAGRDFAMRVLLTKLSPTGVIVMDDIQDNLFFRHFVQRQGRPHRVFEFEGKYLGMIGP